MGDIDTFVVSSAPSSKVQIGDACSLYKTCGLCGGRKHYREFGRRGGNLRKRKSFCTACASNRKDEIVKQPPLPMKYDFDVTQLDDSKYDCIYFYGTNNRWRNEVTLQEAIKYVSLGKARIRNPHTIVQLIDKEPFVKYVLERDVSICHSCRNPGTETMKLADRDEVKCFCTSCVALMTARSSTIKIRLRFSPPPSGELHVYCDGSAKGKMYGSGAVLVDTEQVQIYDKHLESAQKQHSLYAELLAVSNALKVVHKYLHRSPQPIISVHIFTDVISIAKLLGKRTKQSKDPYTAREVQEIKLLIQDLQLSYPETQVSVSYSEMRHIPFYRLAHRLSRSYNVPRPVYEIELVPIVSQPKRRGYTPEFRAQIVAEAWRAGQYAAPLEFGFPSTLYCWRRSDLSPLRCLLPYCCGCR